MADGLNDARAMRIAEIMQDFRNIVNYLNQIRVQPSTADYNEEGYVTLRRCMAQAQYLLNEPFNSQPSPRGDAEEDKATLRRIITDAAYRRFKAKKLYLLATSCLRWVNMRSSILQGRPAGPQQQEPLRQLQRSFQSEVAAITDARVEQSLRAADVAEGKWLNEDPSLAVLQRMAAANGFYNTN